MKHRTFLVILVLGVVGCTGGTSMIEGGVYSIDDGGGKFEVVKIFKLEPGIVHVHVYKNKFAARPTTIRLEELLLGSINYPDGFGMGHLSLTEKDFAGWKAV